MKLHQYAATLGLTLAAANAGAALEIEFVEPQRYRDAALDGYGDASRDRTLVELRRHFEQLAARCLAPGQTLKLRVLDVDLAGHFDWPRYRSDELRVMRDVTWPSMRMAWSLSGADGAMSAPREERIADMHYLTRLPLRSGSDSLRYEKAMLDEWFARRFCASTAAR